jgi:hypothetical protein
MKRLAILLCMLAAPAFAQEVYGNVAVSDATPTLVPPAASVCTTCKTLRIQNGGGNVIYCSPDASVTTDTGVFAVSASEGWVSVPYRRNIYCIAATAAQTGAGRSRTYYWAVQD